MTVAGNPYPFSKLLYTSDNKYFYYNSGSITVASPTGGQNEFFSFMTGNFYHVGQLNMFCQDDDVFLVKIVNGKELTDPTFLEVDYNTNDGANPTTIPLILPPLTQITGFCTVSASPNTRVNALYSGKTGGTIRQQDQVVKTINTEWAKNG